MRKSLFFDVFELKVTHIDHEAVEEDLRLRFQSNGRVKIFEGRAWRAATAGEVRKFLEPIAKKYRLFQKEWRPGST